jgi:hypothetical protein
MQGAGDGCGRVQKPAHELTTAGTRAFGLCAQRVSKPAALRSPPSGVELRWAHRLESLCSSSPDSTRVSRVGDRVLVVIDFSVKTFRRDAEINTRDACATRKKWERHSAKHRTERAEFARYPPSREVISGSFFRRRRSQLFQVFSCYHAG